MLGLAAAFALAAGSAHAVQLPAATGAAQTLPTTAVGTAAVSTPVTFTMTAGGSLGTPLILTLGAPNLDFTLGTGSTCTGSVGTGSCVVNVIFKPTAPGLRMGAVELTNSTGTVIATAFIQATGTGPLATFSPGVISTIAGNGSYGYTGDGGPATAATLNGPYGLILDAAGNMYFADYSNYVVRKITAATGIITTAAGTGTRGYSGDGGPATAANFSFLRGLTLDGAGNLYVADTNNQRIRMINAANGIVTTVAGTGSSGYSASQDGGPATSARLSYPQGVTVDGAGNLYIADSYVNRIRKVSTATGIITTIAGSGAAGYSGDGGPAISANLTNPVAVTVDGQGNLFIADYGNSRVRKVSPNGVITTVAGTGTRGYMPSQDGGLAVAAQISYPSSLTVDAGDLYIGDANQTIRKVTAATGIISTVAGTGVQGYVASQDNGPANHAELDTPYGLALDNAGNLYISDFENYRIRKVTATAAPVIFPQTSAGTNSAAQTMTVNNLGNADLILPIPASGTNAQLGGGGNYTLSNSSTCPQPSATSPANGVIPAGSSCYEMLLYSPTGSGPSSGYLQFTDNSLNVAGATQTFNFSGTTNTANTLSLTVADASTTTYSSTTLSFIVGYGTSLVPTATPVVTVAGSTAGMGPVTCKNKAGHMNCSVTYTPTNLASSNRYIILVTQPADSNYPNAGTATGTLTVTGGSNPCPSQVQQPGRPAC